MNFCVHIFQSKMDVAINSIQKRCPVTTVMTYFPMLGLQAEDIRLKVERVKA